MNCADLVLHGGTVVTDLTAGPPTDALAVRGGVVTALGADAVASIGPSTEVVHLATGVVLPAFRDGHAHPLLGGLELTQAPLAEATSLAQTVEVVRRHARAHPALEWVVGGGYEPSLAPDGVFEASWLDAAVPDRPVVLLSSDHHVVWCNSEALRRAGITATTPDPPAGEIVRHADGSPAGTLREWSAMALVRSLVPEPGHQERVAGLRAAAARFAAHGVVWVQEAMARPSEVGAFLDYAAGKPSVRAGVALLVEPDGWPERRASFAEARAAAAGDRYVAVRTVKFFADGVVEAGTAAMLEPYADQPDHRGLPVWPTGELAEAVAAFDADGFQVHIHAIGDAGVRTALDAIAYAAERNGPADRRPVLAHAQLVDPADLARFAALGVVVNFSPVWAQLDLCQHALTLPRLGPRRSMRQFPMATVSATGAAVSFGSDWPVTSLRPLEGLAVAVTRQTRAGEPSGGWLPAERLAPAAAFAAYTTGVAYQAFEEASRGSLAIGQRADLIHLGADPFDTPPGEWPDIPVLGTWLEGRRTHGE